MLSVASFGGFPNWAAFNYIRLEKLAIGQVRIICAGFEKKWQDYYNILFKHL